MYYFWMYLGQWTKGHEIKTGFLFHCPIHYIRGKKKKTNPGHQMLCPEKKQHNRLVPSVFVALE